MKKVRGNDKFKMVAGLDDVTPTKVRGRLPCRVRYWQWVGGRVVTDDSSATGGFSMTRFS